MNKDSRTWLAALALALCVPLADAQDTKPGKIARIGRLSPLSAEADAPNLTAFRNGLRDLGWIEDRDFRIEGKFAEGRPERLPELAAQLVGARVDLILAGSTQGALAAKRATSSIPIVMVTTGDPIKGGIVSNLARPGGNITGVTAFGEMLALKRLEMLKETVPGVARVAVLANPTSPYTSSFVREAEDAAKALQLQLQVIQVQDPERLEDAFAAISNAHADALFVLTDVMFDNNRKHIVALAARNRLPAMYSERGFVVAGGLMFYGASLGDMYTRAAAYADRILKGSKPSDVPIEQPTKLELIFNAAAAKAIGLSMPPSVLTRAQQVVP